MVPKKVKTKKESRNIPKRIMALFLAVGLIFIIQMVWWIIFFVQSLKENIEDRHVRMLILEGGFFILLIFAGLYLIYRVLQQQVRLKQQTKDFFAGFSHELKTPIAAMKLQAETLQSRSLPEEKVQHLLANMLEDLERLELSIENIMDVFRFESGGFNLDRRPVRLDAWIRETVERLMLPYVGRNAEVHFDLQAGTEVVIDEHYFEIVPANIIQNAMRYTRGKPVLKVSTRCLDGHAEVRFTDNGIGIEKHELQKLFARFYRIRSEDALKWKGSGLGLFISQQLSQAHGFTLSAESDGPGKGATFIITMPVER